MNMHGYPKYNDQASSLHVPQKVYRVPMQMDVSSCKQQCRDFRRNRII